MKVTAGVLTVIALSGCGHSKGDAVQVTNDGGWPDTESQADGGTRARLPLGSRVVALRLSDTSGAAQRDLPVTFAQVFRRGDVPKGAMLSGRIGKRGVRLQVDDKATYADGSLKHAVISLVLENLGGGQGVELELVSSERTKDTEPLSPGDLLATPFELQLQLTIGNALFRASARELLGAPAIRTWLAGDLCTEWEGTTPVRSEGKEHPQLTARFNVRTYAGLSRTRVEVTVENTRAFAPHAQGVTYDLTVSDGTGPLYTKPGLAHHDKARFRRVFWIGKEPEVFVAHDADYLVATNVVPRYDPTLRIAESALAGFDATLTDERTAPMGTGLMAANMPDTGGRPDIGLLPGWAAAYAMSMDPRAKRATLLTGDAGGSFRVHYRDEKTDHPISLADYPDLTLLGSPGDTAHPFAACERECDSPLNHDSAHQPSIAFLPYVVTGDHYYLEELEFWANYNIIQANPAYREYERGLVKWDQVRGQAWSLRTLGQVAFIVPDTDPLNAYFADKLEQNLAYYETFASSSPNELGVLTEGPAFPYHDGLGVAPWQDDFFTSAIGYLNELGFERAKKVLDFKARFVVGRMTAPDYCWIQGAPYTLEVRSAVDAALYDSFAKLYEVNFAKQTNSRGVVFGTLPCASQQMADFLTQEAEDDANGRAPYAPDEMVGYADSPEGYPSNLQPALAMAVESGNPQARAAWNVFQARSIKPDHASEPQFAIVPREREP